MGAGRRRFSRAAAAVGWALAATLLTAAMVALRGGLDKAHVALLYLLLVLAASAGGGRVPGVAMAVAGFLCFNYFFLPPYDTLVVHDPRDWLVLLTFLIVAMVAAQLLHRARRGAEESASRAREIDRISLRAEALREADRLKDALLASVSHDLRTPLTTIKALAHDLSDTGDDRAVTIEEEADRLNRLVADLLDLSRLNGGALPLSLELIAADDLLGAVIQRVTPSLGARELRASLDPAEPLLVGRFDFVHSLRILVNLVENAHKYSPPGSPIELSARRVGPSLEFRVADLGSGVPASEQEAIFEPFQRLSGLRSDAGGVGLGLSIARRLAEAQGGALAYEPRPGGGSLLVLSLPAAEIDLSPAE